VHLGEIAVDGDTVYWSEGRPLEGGRYVVVRRDPDGMVADVTPQGYNARTRVHEYGGGAWWADAGVVWFANWVDQRLYRRDPDTGRSAALTPVPRIPRGDRYADGMLSPDRETIVCVREHHPPDGRGPVDVRNEIVQLAANEPSTPEVLVSGPDFVSSPGFSPDAGRLCWVDRHSRQRWQDSVQRVGERRSRALVSCQVERNGPPYRPTRRELGTAFPVRKEARVRLRPKSVRQRS